MKKIIQKIAKQFGYEIRKYYPANDSSIKIQYLLSHYNIDLVLDVGASIGVYAKRLRLEGYQGKIVSFEPLSSAHFKLQSLSQNNALWIVSPRSVIGDYDGEISINVASNSSSSSILDMEKTHVQSKPKSAYVDT
ncbi:FkbM family methyltransferase [Dapis sp. BLCC M172]|uniref:FkbM family methyltransferase n=1 Tax=Dapis sp. BLCC M172 TaxID=2975281 RepID=UPI003CE88B02